MTQQGWLQTLTSDDGVVFRDLNGNGVLDPYEDPRLPVADRVTDLIGRMSVADKAGLMFHPILEVGQDGTLVEQDAHIAQRPTSERVLTHRLNHFNVHQLPGAELTARWHNRLQKLAEQTPLGIPVTISTDPRHVFSQNVGVSFAARGFSQWPDGLGLGALHDPETVREFADIARREYLAVGIRAALHPTVDLATEPRWGRQLGTFGQDWQLTSDLVAAYLDGFQGPELSATSVACTTKHFPGGGPQLDGEDPHFPYGREQVYPGGRFADHLRPFLTAIEHRTAAIMPYYGMPIGLELDGEPVEEVGFGFNRRIVTDLLRDELGYRGVVLSDWGLLTETQAGPLRLPARAHGVEDLDLRQRMLKALDAGVDQFGGEECADLLVELVNDGSVPQSRLDESARRLLTVKFHLGLFDNPYVDDTVAAQSVGRAEDVAAGLRAQSRSVTVLTNGTGAAGPILPLPTGVRIYSEQLAPEVIARFGEVAATPADADVAVVRLDAPFTPRDTYFLEAMFRQGTLDFSPQTVQQVRDLAAQVPVVLDVMLDRPAILTDLVEIATAVVGTWGTSDQALLAALTGAESPVGRLPFELPRSAAAVAASRSDVPSDTENPLFEYGHGLDLTAEQR